MTLQLPPPEAEGEARRVPFGRWGRLAFVRAWHELGHGYYLIDYTNAKNARSQAWRYAVVRAGAAQSWDTTLRVWVDVPNSPVWIPIATVNRALVHGENAFRIEVEARDEEYRWPWLCRVACRDRDMARDWMIGIVETMYGLDFSE